MQRAIKSLLLDRQVTSASDTIIISTYEPLKKFVIQFKPTQRKINTFITTYFLLCSSIWLWNVGLMDKYISSYIKCLCTVFKSIRIVLLEAAHFMRGFLWRWWKNVMFLNNVVKGTVMLLIHIAFGEQSQTSEQNLTNTTVHALLVIWTALVQL